MIITILTALVAVLAGYAGSQVISKQKVGSAEDQAKKAKEAAKKDAEEIILDAKKEALKLSE